MFSFIQILNFIIKVSSGVKKDIRFSHPPELPCAVFIKKESWLFDSNVLWLRRFSGEKKCIYAIWKTDSAGGVKPASVEPPSVNKCIREFELGNEHGSASLHGRDCVQAVCGFFAFEQIFAQTFVTIE